MASGQTLYQSGPHIMRWCPGLLAFFLPENLELSMLWPGQLGPFLAAGRLPQPSAVLSGRLAVNGTPPLGMFTFQYLWALVVRTYPAQLSGLREPQDSCIS